MLKNKSTLTHSTRISQKNTPNNPKALFGAATETVLRRIIWKMFSRLSAHCFLTFLIQRKFISVESSQFLLSKYVAPCCDIQNHQFMTGIRDNYTTAVLNGRAAAPAPDTQCLLSVCTPDDKLSCKISSTGLQRKAYIMPAEEQVHSEAYLARYYYLGKTLYETPLRQTHITTTTKFAGTHGLAKVTPLPHYNQDTPKRAQVKIPKPDAREAESNTQTYLPLLWRIGALKSQEQSYDQIM